MTREEAIARARKWNLGSLDEEDTIALYELIPELRESEDERIRKLLVWQVHRNIEDETNDLAGSVYDGIKGHDPDLEESIEDWKKCLAWLEKQKENLQNKSAIELWKDMRLEVYQQASGNRHEPNYSDDTTKMFSLTDIDEIFEKFAEKHGEQKLFPKFRIGDRMRTKQEASEGITDGMPVIISIDYAYYYCTNEKIPIAEQDEYEYPTVNVEQKPAEWSGNFEENIRNLLHDKLTWHSEDGKMSSTVFIDDKTLKDIINGIWFYVSKEALKYPNKELNVAEWSEEDENMLNSCISSIEEAKENRYYDRETDGDTSYDHEISWLKSLRPQSHWKPSEEQMEQLRSAAVLPEFGPMVTTRKQFPDLESLYNDLKKLM